MGTAAASAGAAGPSEGLRAGWSSGRTEAGVPRGERTTRLRTRADDRHSEPDYLLRPTRHGPGGTLLDYRSVRFIVGQLTIAWDHTTFESALLNDIFLRKWRYALIGNKRKRWPRPLISAMIHIPCAVYSCSLEAVERRSEGATQAYILYGQKGLVALEFRATKSFARTF